MSEEQHKSAPDGFEKLQELRAELFSRHPTAYPEFLRWIADRLVHVHGENENVDYVISLRSRAAALQSLAAKEQS